MKTRLGFVSEEGSGKRGEEMTSW